MAAHTISGAPQVWPSGLELRQRRAKVLQVVDSVSAFEALVDRAQLSTGSLIVQITRFDRDSGLIESLAWAGLTTGPAGLALQMSRRLFPNFDPFSVKPPVTINPWNERVYLEGRPIIAAFDEVALHAVDHRILALAMGVAKLRESYMHPLRVRGEIFGALGFHTTAFSLEQLRAAQDLVPEAESLAEAYQMVIAGS